MFWPRWTTLAPARRLEDLFLHQHDGELFVLMHLVDAWPMLLGRAARSLGKGVAKNGQ